MITSNPFAELSALIPPDIMQAYVILMVLLVIGGTLLDVVHKKSARYFFENAQKAKKAAKRQVGDKEKIGLAFSTLKHEVLSAGEFDNRQRQISHLFMMYGFIIFVVATAVMIFGLPAAESEASTLMPLLWHLGALMICIGGYWFWFKIRVDVSSEGHQWYEVQSGRHICRLADRDGDFRSDLVSPPVCRRWCACWRCVFPFHRRVHHTVQHRIVVQVCPHVLQACCGVSEEDHQGRWFERESAR